MSSTWFTSVFPLTVIVVDRRRHAAQHFLRQIGGVGVLQAAPPGEAVHHRSVQANELAPCRFVEPITQAHQQARARRRDVGHPGSSASTSCRRVEIYRRLCRIFSWIARFFS